MAKMRECFKIGDIETPAPLWIIGPDVIEDEGFALEVAHVISECAQRRNIPVVFKASYEKANRSSTAAFRGPGL
ncbi:MAG: 3-deoxy-8-phosphooctulonate synthase, partial [Planctomycetia bacterium]|nr:3-deoxy-8-phosphooctulonate synthase [Planctomycetia bacterium]